MKKILILLYFLIFSTLPIIAIEEVSLEEEHLKLGTYGDYLADVYYGRVEEAPVILKLFSKDGLKFENSKINSVKLHFLYSGHLSYLNKEHLNDIFQHQFNTVEPKISVDFNDNKSQVMFDINLTRDIKGYSNWFTQRMTMLYFSHKITPEQLIVLGQYARIPTSFDGSQGLYAQDMFNKSQLGRTLGNTLAVGIRNLGKYKYLDYDIGIYDSTRYMKEFGNGLDFTGYTMFKPLANCKETTGDLKIGAGYSVGKNHISYSQYSFFTGYDIKKFHAKVEYSGADGYNGIYESKNSVAGMYTTLAYDLTPKLTVLGRYDIFDKNIHARNNTVNEYTIGLTYKPFENMKLLLNYVTTHGNNQPSSNSILFATRFIL